MSMALKLDAIGSLHSISASDVKKLDWCDVMHDIQKNGRVAVTNHGVPEAVILLASEYEAIVRILEEPKVRSQLSLDGLRKHFDERLKALKAPGASSELLVAAKTPVKLHGKVKAGKWY